MVKEILLRVVRRAMPVNPERGGVEAIYGRLPGGRFVQVNSAPDLIDLVNDIPYDQYVLDFTLEDGTVKTVTYVLEEVVGAILVHCEDPIPELQLCFGFPRTFECPVWFHNLETKTLQPAVEFRPTEPGTIDPRMQVKITEVGEHLGGDDDLYFTVKTYKQFHRTLLAFSDNPDRPRRNMRWFGEDIVAEGVIDRENGTFRALAYDLAGNMRKDLGFAVEISVQTSNSRRDVGKEVDLSATAPLVPKTRNHPVPRTNKRAHFKK